MGALILAQIKHLTYILVPDLTGELELVREPLDSFFIEERFGPDELQGDFLAHFGVVNFVNPAHSAMAQFFDDLVAAGERCAGRQLFYRRLDGLCDFGMNVFGRGQLCPAISAELLGLRILSLTFRASDGHG
jgi:hypothetical protein